MIENELGHAVKDIKKTATALNNDQIINETTDLIKTWKDMQSKQLGGKRDSPERCMKKTKENIYQVLNKIIQKTNPYLQNQKASSDSPPASTTGNEHKKIRLAIQKDPPAARPKAMTDPNFFTSSLASDVKYRTVRPVYSVSPSKEDQTPASSSTVTTTTRPPKKSVTFAENLYEIREYEKNPEEWTSFVSYPLLFFILMC